MVEPLWFMPGAIDPIAVSSRSNIILNDISLNLFLTLILYFSLLKTLLSKFSKISQTQKY